MGIDPQFLSDLKSHAEFIGTVTAAAGFILAIYQLWVPPHVMVRNHQRLTAAAQWMSHGTWLALMQRGVRWVLRLMELLYGPPRRGSQRFISEFLTVRAWKMSAWIAAFLLLVVPLLLLAFAIPIVEFHNGRPVPWEVPPVAIGAAVILAIPFALTWRTIRRVDEFADHHGIENLGVAAYAILVEGTTIAIIPSLAILIGVPLIQLLPNRPVLINIMLTIIIGSSVIAIVTGMIRAIRRHGFLAPVAFICILIVFFIYIIQSILFLTGLNAVRFEFDFSIILFIMCWVLANFNIFKIVKMHIAKHNGTYYYIDETNFIGRFLCIILIMGALVFWESEIDFNLFISRILELVISFVFILLTPVIFTVYSAIYSNAIPDCTSVALTRSVLTRASHTQSLRHFFWLLLIDLISVIGFCIVTLLILMVSFTISKFIIAFASDFSSVSAAKAMQNFFNGGILIPVVLFELLTDGRASSWVASNPESNGALTIIILSILSLTSLIPTLLNGCVIIGLILARSMAIIIMPPFKILYDLLLIDDDNKEENTIKKLRSSVLISILFSIVLCVIYYLFWILSR